jgi:hypothetical protein
MDFNCYQLFHEMGGVHSDSEFHRFSSHKIYVGENPIHIFLPPENSYGQHPSIQIYGNDNIFSKIQHCVGTFHNLLSSGKWVGRIVQQNFDEYNQETINGEYEGLAHSPKVCLMGKLDRH